ncbi:signal transduction histidine kinase [Rhabdobacter roseus]|uniref:histidine kinase n=1 Tax=Rhabdobacter roseus TaxID=1655419 RepID=A0A840TZV3_9BACT|nr:HAMP domain-containing sensor histidine kinase [Rhabdobacter roseus]MBB5285169.1 signal transduction histidine kinase [Rhabdobacter roseus]
MNLLRRNKLPTFLMVASLVLLAAFQAFWLRKEYFEQKNLLQKETDLLLRTTIQALEDSVFQQKVGKYFLEEKTTSTPASPKPKIIALRLRQSEKGGVLPSADTLLPELENSAFFTATDLPATAIKSIKVLRSSSGIGDSLRLQGLLHDSTRQPKIEIRIVSAKGQDDSLQQIISRVLRPIQASVAGRQEEAEVRPSEKPRILRSRLPVDKKIVIQLGKDTLSLQAVQTDYAQRIRQAQIPLAFTMQRNAGVDSTSTALRTEPVRSTMPTGSTYSAAFTRYQPYLLRKITPQLLFSLFLLATTALAFAVIYRNLQRQQRLVQLKNDFISNVTHELKTPIATVGVALEALQSFGVDRNPEQTREYLAISRQELDRLAMLVDKVLKTALFEQQSLALAPEPLDAAELVQQVLGTLRPQLEKYNAQYQYVPEGSDFGLRGDRIHLTNVLYNLLDNALKYSPSTPIITIRLWEDATHLRLEVLDEGIGIPELYQQKIFEKFFRVPSGDVHNVKGYGLGLSYVASVVRSHGGSIEVESTLGHGSRFTIQLPRNLSLSSTASTFKSTPS